MAAEQDDFNVAGPKHLTVVDWGNGDHRRSVAASLVNGVYIIESDRLKGRVGPNALGPAWWEFFHFRLDQTLVDKNKSIFGAVFEYEPNKSSTDGFPNYIVAFRGTMLEVGSAKRDMFHNIMVGLNKLHRMSRAKNAFSVVIEIISRSKNTNVWLAGHSLGASMALVVGQQMSRLPEGSINLESFLFNPPYASLQIESYFKDQKVAKNIRMCTGIFKAGLAVAVKKEALPSSSSERVVGATLAKWAPNLFVHPSDMICAEYIAYFATKRQMVELSMGGVAALASQHTITGLMLSALGGKAAKPAAHLIHSARLTVNKSPEPVLKRAHSLEQWWSSDMDLDTDDHLYD